VAEDRADVEKDPRLATIRGVQVARTGDSVAPQVDAGKAARDRLVPRRPCGQLGDRLVGDRRVFVSQGYAWVEPNVRGSAGFGRAFEEADNGATAGTPSSSA